jgi:uncharacterized protein YbcI
MGRDHIVVFLEDIYTTVERTLIDAGKFDAVHLARNEFQEAMRPRFMAAVEELTGRKVFAFLSQVGIDPDVAAEIFWLVPENDGDAG